ncbi:MAG: hypothetical protein AAF564_03735 [Bacteroidota bacterium]
MKHFVRIFFLLCLVVPTTLQAQNFRAEIKQPKLAAQAAAEDMVATLFTNLKAGKSQEIAEWITGQVGYNWDATTKVQQTNEFKSQLDVILISPPASSYGALDSYDLIDESYLPGSDRYFRRTYISYHEGAPLVWEFRFYVKPDGGTALNAIQWEGKNPFEYMSTGDMLLNRWYDN